MFIVQILASATVTVTATSYACSLKSSLPISILLISDLHCQSVDALRNVQIALTFYIEEQMICFRKFFLQSWYSENIASLIQKD